MESSKIRFAKSSISVAGTGSFYLGVSGGQILNRLVEGAATELQHKTNPITYIPLTDARIPLLVFRYPVYGFTNVWSAVRGLNSVGKITPGICPDDMYDLYGLDSALLKNAFEQEFSLHVYTDIIRTIQQGLKSLTDPSEIARVESEKTGPNPLFSLEYLMRSFLPSKFKNIPAIHTAILTEITGKAVPALNFLRTMESRYPVSHGCLITAGKQELVNTGVSAINRLMSVFSLT